MTMTEGSLARAHPARFRWPRQPGRSVPPPAGKPPFTKWLSTLLAQVIVDALGVGGTSHVENGRRLAPAAALSTGSAAASAAPALGAIPALSTAPPALPAFPTPPAPPVAPTLLAARPPASPVVEAPLPDLLDAAASVAPVSVAEEDAAEAATGPGGWRSRNQTILLASPFAGFGQVQQFLRRLEHIELISEVRPKRFAAGRLFVTLRADGLDAGALTDLLLHELAVHRPAVREVRADSIELLLESAAPQDAGGDQQGAYSEAQVKTT